jgi:hypothetical protein
MSRGRRYSTAANHRSKSRTATRRMPPGGRYGQTASREVEPTDSLEPKRGSEDKCPGLSSGTTLHGKLRAILYGSQVKFPIIIEDQASEERAPVAHACNPRYSGGRDQEDHGSRPTL